MNYLDDLHKYIETVPYGGINFRVERVNRKTVRIITTAEETLKYVDNKEAIKDLGSMLNQLIDTSYTGEVQVKLELKDGLITLMGIFDKKETKYKD